MNCSVDGCHQKSTSRGLCNAHWKRWRKYGEPTAGSTGKGEVILWVNSTALNYRGDDCLIWPFYRKPEGYGMLTRNGRTYPAHRYICGIVHGPAPSPCHVAAHNCGKGHLGCVNPSHIRWATKSENQLDRIGHGTGCTGEDCKTAKITKKQALSILLASGKAPRKELSRIFGVSESTIGQIQRGYRWGWLHREIANTNRRELFKEVRHADQ